MEIYLDNAATTKPLNEAMEAHTGAGWYNPSAAYGAAEAVFLSIGRTRRLLCETLGLAGGGCVFTSGGTEANNLCLLSCFRRGAHYVTSTIEHPSVYAVFAYMEQQGARVSYVKPRGFCVTADDVAAKVREDTVLVSVMHVNNETGALNDIAAICGAVKARNKKTLFHSDGVQALQKLPVSLALCGADYYSVSAHKIHGLKGTGALLYRKGAPVKPLIHGGGQEFGLRSGTENTPGIQAFDAALRCGRVDTAHVQALHTALAAGLGSLPGARLNMPDSKAPHILSVSFEGIRAEVLARLLGRRGILIGTGAACARGKISRVLLECGVKRPLAEGAVRISLSVYNTADDIDACTRAIGEAVEQLQRGV